jgi:hypothetical protein
LFFFVPLFLALQEALAGLNRCGPLQNFDFKELLSA